MTRAAAQAASRLIGRTRQRGESSASRDSKFSPAVHTKGKFRQRRRDRGTDAAVVRLLVSNEQ